MIEDAKDALKAATSGQGDPHTARKREQTHPKGMEPGIIYDPSTGRGNVVAAVSPGQDPCWNKLLESMGFAEVVDVLDVIEVRAWQVYSKDVGKPITLHYIKARVKRKIKAQDREDIDALCKRIAKKRIKAPPKEKQVKDLALIIGLADWQAGKNSGGGAEALTERLLRLCQLIVGHIRELSRLGRRPKRIYVVGMGDLFEACSGHYKMQAFQIELDRRQQTKLIRHALVKLAVVLAPLAIEIIFMFLPGNHGENREDGLAFTNWGDNDDVAVGEQVAEICAGNPDLAHIKFVIPDQEMTLTVDAFGTAIGFAHGHQCKRGPKDLKPLTWWKDMGFAEHPIGSCSVLVTAHFHHLRVVVEGKKTWFQCPANDGGSPWWEHRGGASTMPGTLTFLAGEACGDSGWSDMKVLS